MQKYKARPIGKDYQQKHGEDYKEVFVYIILMKTVYLLISLTGQIKWKTGQLDMNSVFWMAILKRRSMPNNHWILWLKDMKNKVLRLKKALYMLKQALKVLILTLTSIFEITVCLLLSWICFYVRSYENGDMLLICIYVDDVTFNSNNPNLFEDLKKTMLLEFETTDMELIKYYLSIKVK